MNGENTLTHTQTRIEKPLSRKYVKTNTKKNCTRFHWNDTSDHWINTQQDKHHHDGQTLIPSNVVTALTCDGVAVPLFLLQLSSLDLCSYICAEFWQFLSRTTTSFLFSSFLSFIWTNYQRFKPFHFIHTMDMDTQNGNITDADKPHKTLCAARQRQMQLATNHYKLVSVHELICVRFIILKIDCVESVRQWECMHCMSVFRAFADHSARSFIHVYGLWAGCESTNLNFINTRQQKMTSWTRIMCLLLVKSTCF